MQWGENFLSMGGKEILIKTMLQSIPVYVMGLLSYLDWCVMIWLKPLAIFGGVQIMVSGRPIGAHGKAHKIEVL